MHSKIDLYKQLPPYPGNSLTLHLDNIKKLLCGNYAYDSKLNYVRDYQRNYKRINRTKGMTIQ